MKFTAEQAFEASESGEPIILTVAVAEKIAKQHDADMYGFDALYAEHGNVDAADLFRFLGY